MPARSKSTHSVSNIAGSMITPSRRNASISAGLTVRGGAVGTAEIVRETEQTSKNPFTCARGRCTLPRVAETDRRVADDWALQPAEQLPAAEGSDYMESLRSRGGSRSPVTKLAERARRALRRLLPRRS